MYGIRSFKTDQTFDQQLSRERWSNGHRSLLFYKQRINILPFLEILEIPYDFRKKAYNGKEELHYHLDLRVAGRFMF